MTVHRGTKNLQCLQWNERKKTKKEKVDDGNDKKRNDDGQVQARE